MGVDWGAGLWEVALTLQIQGEQPQVTSTNGVICMWPATVWLPW